MKPLNDFSQLDAQSEVSRLAHVRSDEQDPAEFDAWLAETRAHEQDVSDQELADLLSQPEPQTV